MNNKLIAGLAGLLACIGGVLIHDEPIMGGILAALGGFIAMQVKNHE